MNRPTIDQFFPSGTTPGDIQLAFACEPELYKYITALDAYVDWMESDMEDSGQICHGCGKRFENPESVKVDFCKECLDDNVPCNLIRDGNTYECTVCGNEFDDSYADECGYVNEKPDHS